MKSYKRYIEKLENFEIRAIDPFQDIFKNGNYRFGDIEGLEQLKGYIITELREAAPGNIKLKLKKLREKNKFLVEFDENFPELYSKSKNGLLRSTDLTSYLPLLDTSNAQEFIISTQYLKTVYHSVLDRQKSLLELIDRIEDLLVAL